MQLHFGSGEGMGKVQEGGRSVWFCVCTGGFCFKISKQKMNWHLQSIWLLTAESKQFINNIFYYISLKTFNSESVPSIWKIPFFKAPEGLNFPLKQIRKKKVGLLLSGPPSLDASEPTAAQGVGKSVAFRGFPWHQHWHRCWHSTSSSCSTLLASLHQHPSPSPGNPLLPVERRSPFGARRG